MGAYRLTQTLNHAIPVSTNDLGAPEVSQMIQAITMGRHYIFVSDVPTAQSLNVLRNNNNYKRGTLPVAHTFIINEPGCDIS